MGCPCVVPSRTLIHYAGRNQRERCGRAHSNGSPATPKCGVAGGKRSVFRPSRPDALGHDPSRNLSSELHWQGRPFRRRCRRRRGPRIHLAKADLPRLTIPIFMRLRTTGGARSLAFASGNDALLLAKTAYAPGVQDAPSSRPSGMPALLIISAFLGKGGFNGGSSSQPIVVSPH